MSSLKLQTFVVNLTDTKVGTADKTKVRNMFE